MQNFYKNIVLVFFLWISAGINICAQPQIQSVTPNGLTIARYEKFELTVALSATFSSPYDFDQVNLQGIFTSPSGNVFVVDGFYYQAFTMPEPNVLVADGVPGWRIRFSPNQAGTWNYVVKVTDTQGTATFSNQQFTCTSSTHKGFVKRSGANLVYDNGDRFIALGTNLAWTEWATGFTIYNDWISTLKSNGGNYVKITMAPWIFGLEWGAGTLGNYTSRQNRAWALDWVFDKLLQNNVYCQLHFLVHDELRTESNTGWNENPFKSTNGGPCVNPQDFFTNATAKKFYKQKIRYAIARWGYSSYLHSWEVMSETDNTGFYSSNYSQTYNWVVDMTDYVKTRDVHQRPVTSGYAWPQNDPAYWSHNLVDYSQIHLYDFIPDLEMKVYNYSRHYIDKFQKPHIAGEFALGHNPTTINQSDPGGVAFHNVLWSSVFSGTMGSAMSWWWDNYLYPNGLFGYFQPISSFISQVNIKETSWYHEMPLTSSNTHETLEVFPDFSSTSAKAPANTFYIGPSGSISPTVMDMGQHLFGGLYASLRNPPAFHVNYIKPGKFRVRTGNLAVLSKVKIRLNGVTLVNTTASTNSTYSIDVPAGIHVIEVDNSGTGILKIEKYILENYMPQLRAFTLRKSNHVAGWFQNINYHWKKLQESGPPAPISGGKIELGNLTPGLYKVNWYNGNAVLDSTQLKFAQNGSLSLDAPPIVWDGAFDAKFFVPFNIDFAASPRSGFSPLTVQFTDQTTYTTGGNFSWMWNFGDGTFSFQQNPQKTYSNPGSYTVSLQVSQGQYFHSVTKASFIVVEQPLVANFYGSPTIVLPGSPVQFTDLSLGGPVSWLWNFGDDTFGFQKNPPKIYNQPGNYTVSLTVQKGSQNSTMTKTNYIQVLVPLVADFTSDATLALPGQPIAFTDLSTGLPTSWSWNFGNGTTSNLKNPVISYANPGIYNVSLTVTTAHQQNSITKNAFITILPVLIADFATDTTLVVAGNPVSFTDLSAGSPTSWSWNFGNGQTSSLQNPTHTFSQAGFYTISLTVNDPLQTSTKIRQNYMQALEPLLAGFSASATTVLPGQNITFADTSTGSPSTWLWNFGNGITSTLQNPSLSYTAPGTYSVSLTVMNDYQQNTVQKTDYITVLVPMVADFVANTIVGWTGQTIQFTDLTTSNPDTWLWGFGDGQGSTVQNPSHVFSQEGYYTISLTANNLYQSSTVIKTNYLYIREPLVTDFTADTTLVVMGDSVQFSDLTTGFPESWSWTFGDGKGSLKQHPKHAYQAAGEYTVSLRARRGFYNNLKVKTNYIKVIPRIEAAFTSDKQLAFVDEPVQFTDLSTGNPDSWFWDFGNFSNAVNQHPEMYFNDPGIYTISLTVANEYLQDSLVKPGFITVIEPLVANFAASVFEVNVGEKVQFSDLTTGSPDSWQWFFSSGDTSLVQNPWITFWQPGFVDVTLIVQNQYLSDTITKLAFIYVKPTAYSQNLSLPAGWSGVSTYIQPTSLFIEDIFSAVTDRLVYAFNEQGIFWPAFNINTIGIWDITKGLIVNMSAPGEVTIEGYQLVEEQKLLSQGWNIFPVLSPCERPAETLLQPLEGSFQLIKTADGTKVYWPETGVNTLQILKPGISYLIFVHQENLFTFPVCGGN